MKPIGNIIVDAGYVIDKNRAIMPIALSVLLPYEFPITIGVIKYSLN